MKEFIKKPFVGNILSALAVAFFGFILLSLTFLLDFLFQRLIDGIILLFKPVDINMVWAWFPTMKHILFVVIIILISWLVFRSRLNVLYKAIYMNVPTAVVLATLGIFTYRWPIITYSVGGLLCVCTLYYFNRTKQPWLYYYTVVLVGLILTIFTLSGGEI